MPRTLFSKLISERWNFKHVGQTDQTSGYCDDTCDEDEDDADEDDEDETKSLTKKKPSKKKTSSGNNCDVHEQVHHLFEIPM